MIFGSLSKLMRLPDLEGGGKNSCEAGILRIVCSFAESFTLSLFWEIPLEFSSSDREKSIKWPVCQGEALSY
jgi:hypothetical protein